MTARTFEQHWKDVSGPIVQHLSLQIRMNLQMGRIEIRTCDQTKDASALERGAEFIGAFVSDCVAET